MSRAARLPLTLFAATAAQALATFTVFVLPVLAPLASATLGIGAQWIGVQMALTYGAAAVTSAAVGPALLRFGPARCTQAALAAAAFACASYALAWLPGMALGALATGLGYGLTNPAASQVLSRMTPPARRNMVFAIKQTGVPLGAALAGLLLPSLAQAIGWRGAALATACTLAALTLAYTPFRAAWDTDRDPSVPLRANQGGALRALRQRPGLLGLAIAGGTYSAIQLAFGAYLVTMLVAEFHWTPVAAGLATALVQVTGAVARIAWGWVADRVGSGLRTLAAIGLLSAGSAALVPFATGWPQPAVLALLAFLGFCVAGWNGVLIAEADRLAAPGRAGEAVGGVLVLSFGGVVLGPSLQALLVTLAGGYAPAFGLLALLPLAGAVVAWRTARAPATPP